MKQQVHWGWNGENIELFGEDGQIIFTCHPKHYVDMKDVLAYYTRTEGDYITPWEQAKSFTRRYGITPTNVAKKFNGIRYSEVISKHPEWAKVVQTKKGRINPWLFETLVSVELVDHAIKDGLRNITPFIVYYNESPKELKKRFGDKVWKKLCKNSYTRNRLIMHAGRISLPPDGLQFLDNYPSTLLKGRWYTSDYRALNLALQVVGCSMSKMNTLENVRAIARICQTWEDTERMCNARGIAFNPNWSWRRIQEEHHNLTTEQQREYQRQLAERDLEYAKLLAVDFRTLHKGLQDFKFDSGVVATALTNMEQVQVEGQKMHHCVGSYATECARGQYVVYHLTKGAEEVTLGINCTGPNVHINGKEHRAVTYRFNQMYHACNKIVEDSDFVKAADEIIDKLNKAAKISAPKELETV